MRLPERIVAVSDPPLLPLMERAAVLRRAGREIFMLAQATVDYAPPETFSESLASALSGGMPDLHLYAPDPGLPELREALAGYLDRDFGLAVDPAREILVTPGANHAAFTALSVILDPGDEVLLISPWYFNHEMAARLAGAVVREVPAPPGDGFIPSLEALDAAWSPRTRALILVHPGNPTGACLPGAWIDGLARLLGGERRWADVYLLVDQTYQEIYFGSAPPQSPARNPDLRDRTVTVGSFSKCFGLAGWRLGFLAAAPSIVSAALKVQDSSVICAPRGPQWALSRVLGDPGAVAAYLQEKRLLLARRRDALLAPLASFPAEPAGRGTPPALLPVAGAPASLLPVAPAGACFAFLSLPGLDGTKTAWTLLEGYGVATVPGIYFGPAWSQGLRLAFGTESEARLMEAGERIRGCLDSPPRDLCG